MSEHCQNRSSWYAFLPSSRRIASMKPTNVVSMDFNSPEAMEKFIEMYERDGPSLYPQAELLVLVKTEETSLLAIAAYPTEDDRLKASETAQERIKGQFAPLFSESFRLLGDMVVHHTPNSKVARP